MFQRNKVTENGATDNNRKPSEQALEVVDVAFGAVPIATDAVRRTFEQWSDADTREYEQKKLQAQLEKLRDSDSRSQQIEDLKERLQAEFDKAKAEGPKVRRKVTDQLVEQARKARKRVEPVYQPAYDRVEPLVKDRVEPVYRKRVEPVVRERFEPVYRKRVEPTVQRVRERI
jgi:hypothetical protein